MSLSPELLFGIGALLLLAAIIYGAVRYKVRDKALDPVTEAATREGYKDPELKKEP